MRHVAVSIILVCAVTGCASATRSAPTTTVPSATVATTTPTGASSTSATTASTTIAATTTTAALPVPTVVLGAMSDLPAMTAAAYASSGSTEVVVGNAIPATPGSLELAVAATRTAGGPWQLVTIDDGKGYRPPTTASNNQRGFAPYAVAAGPAGFVAVGSAAFFVGNVAKGSGGLVWFSPDGISWQRIDVRPAIANLDPSGLQLREVAATATGYVAVGITGPRVLVLTSPDGVTWAQTTEFQATWALLPHALFVDGNHVLVWLDEFDCLKDAFGNGAQPRLQWSDDAGASFTEIPASLIATIANIVPEPDPTTCEPLSHDLNQLSTMFNVSVGVVGIARGTIYVTSPDGASVASSPDRVHWTKASLPTPPPAKDTVYLSRQQPGAVLGAASGVVVLSGSGPAQAGQPKQLIGWLTRDNGASWTSIKAGPLVDPAGTLSLTPNPDGHHVELLFARTSPTGDVTGPPQVGAITVG